ncbi:MAG TPA: roadblock/LC7 domain-containing protein [Actinocrinis sp.]|jgi:predicted regulator of Ras-like GTPase activity (Roadblock/LC7/MglB family)|uniref:roadblock/LC7 domain-containing protein n=1 Tax=Actinocrinis sp. TaxID=1920516 RepID=UPI002DDC92B3|nr:roadblock/LC7 domain-containing protein [Actinocrinis sp.]HEV3169104.1 roadblock/LC7 domain-containing protein [Actinocrinis sp.]
MNNEESTRQLSWLITGLVERVPQARSALLLSADGLVRARTADLSKDDADHMAAIASGLWSLASGAGRKFAGSGAVRQVGVEMDGALLFVAAAGFGTCISVLTGDAADPGLIGFEMAQLVRSMRPHLQTAPRADHAAAAAAWSRAQP